MTKGQKAENELQRALQELASIYRCEALLEHRFHPTRRWRFDVAFPAAKVAAEIDGGAWAYGRHTRGRGFINDQEKTNEAQLLGWQVYRFVPQDLMTGRFHETMSKALSRAIPS